MTARLIHLLHIEDEETEQLLVAEILNSIAEFTFDITHVESEEAAVAAFEERPVDFVILDYQLTQGDGLSCLRRLRRLAPVVPVVALSGVATPKIAAELLRSGADDYFSKQDLDAAALVRSIREAIARTDAYRLHAGIADLNENAQFGQAFERICESYLNQCGVSILRLIDEFDRCARHVSWTPGKMQYLFEAECRRLDAARPPGEPPSRKVLRPVFLEIMLRLFGAPANESNAATLSADASAR